MTSFLGRPSVSGVRWIGRIMGTLLGLLILSQLPGMRPNTVRDYLLFLGGVLVVLGFAAGWFRELLAFLLVFGGSALVAVCWLWPPRAEGPWQIFVATGILSLLFLYAHLAAKGEGQP